MPNALTRHVSLKAGPWLLETLVRHYFDRLRFNISVWEKEKELEKAHESAAGEKGAGGGGEQMSANVNVDETGKLRRDELLYDEVFHIVKSFLDVSTHHTIEELQQFSNTRTPSSPWMYVMRLCIPMSCCDDAAGYLIDVLGGEEKTRQVVGGTKWWQVRGIKGVDAQWIVARKDYQRIKKQRKQQQAEQSRREASVHSNEEDVYDPEIDELGCILYFHGGGYYFGSVDQERYFIQRFARKSGCRLLAISYRLAPQYPFPCAIQDALAAYLYLIRPPPDAPHTPVNPAHILISGDSAGGGLTLALLQVLRDSGLPLPAGAIPVSPWCDLTHSFPSIHINTDTDVIPKYGLSVYKPSVLWPPPSDEETDAVHAGIRTKIKQVARQYRRDVGDAEKDKKEKEKEEKGDGEERPKRPKFWRKWTFGSKERQERSRSHSKGLSSSRNASKERGSDGASLAEQAKTGDVRAAAVIDTVSHQAEVEPTSVHAPKQTEKVVSTGSAGPIPTADETNDQLLRVVTEDGEVIEVRDQVHMYAPNNLLVHPLVSPALGYLGGLPPILIVASNAEVLRDEIIYTAQKAAHPDRYPVKPEARKLYPKLEGIEERHGPTKVHLQVYDHAAHTFPVLFFVCNSSKFCFRAMANFSKLVFGTLPAPASGSVSVPPSASPSSSSNETATPGRKTGTFKRSTSLNLSIPGRLSRMGSRKKRDSALHHEIGQQKQQQQQQQQQQDQRTEEGQPGAQSQQQPNGNANPQIVEPVATEQVTESPRRTSFVSSHSSISERLDSTASPSTSAMIAGGGVRLAGDPSVYFRFPDGLSSPFVDNMIRERVSTTGQIRPLEPESELPACTMPADRIGVANELVLRRYIEGSSKWNERFAKTKETIRKRRAQSLRLARSDAERIAPRLEMYFYLNASDHEGEGDGGETGLGVTPSSPIGEKTVKEGLKRSAASWAWAWALYGDEKPPPSSIVARRDTEEARRLSRIADLPADSHDHRVSGNNLWSYLVNRLSLERNEARVEQKNVEKDPKGVAKDVSFDTLDLQRRRKEKEEKAKEKAKAKEEKGKEKGAETGTTKEETDKEMEGRLTKEEKGKQKESEPEPIPGKGQSDAHAPVPKDHKHKVRWPRSLSRGRTRDHSQEKRRSIFRLSGRPEKEKEPQKMHVETPVKDAERVQLD